MSLLIYIYEKSLQQSRHLPWIFKLWKAGDLQILDLRILIWKSMTTANNSQADKFCW